MKSILLFVMALTTSAGLADTPPFHNVKNYGAVGDGTTLATAAIQKAVDACAAEGGGKVVIPPGRYLTGPINLRSRVQIDLSPPRTGDCENRRAVRKVLRKLLETRRVA